LRPGKNLKRLGKWSIVTGATGTFHILRASVRVATAVMTGPVMIYAVRWDREGLCVRAREAGAQCLADLADGVETPGGGQGSGGHLPEGRGQVPE
jgi:hypothetical protein